MQFVSEIKKPSYSADPDFITGKKDKNKSFSFSCDNCHSLLDINFKRQIENSWSGKTSSISKDIQNKLKKFYRIGLSEKAHNGGFPVFDKLKCKKCKQSFLTYCGVYEFSNSVFLICVLGIIKE